MQLKALGFWKRSRNQPTVRRLQLLAMIEIFTNRVRTLHNGGENLIDQQIFDRKSISGKITQFCLLHLMRKVRAGLLDWPFHGQFW